METSRSEERMKHVAEVALKSVFGSLLLPKSRIERTPSSEG